MKLYFNYLKRKRPYEKSVYSRTPLVNITDDQDKTKDFFYTHFQSLTATLSLIKFQSMSRTFCLDCWTKESYFKLWDMTRVNHWAWMFEGNVRRMAIFFCFSYRRTKFLIRLTSQTCCMWVHQFNSFSVQSQVWLTIQAKLGNFCNYDRKHKVAYLSLVCFTEPKD